MAYIVPGTTEHCCFPYDILQSIDGILLQCEKLFQCDSSHVIDNCGSYFSICSVEGAWSRKYFSYNHCLMRCYFFQSTEDTTSYLGSDQKLVWRGNILQSDWLLYTEKQSSSNNFSNKNAMRHSEPKNLSKDLSFRLLAYTTLFASAPKNAEF